MQKFLTNMDTVKKNSKFVPYPPGTFTAKFAEFKTKVGIQKSRSRAPSRAKLLETFKECRAAAVDDMLRWNLAVMDRELEWPRGFHRAR